MAEQTTGRTAPEGKQFIRLAISNEAMAAAMDIVAVDELPQHDSAAVIAVVKRLMDEDGLSTKEVAKRLMDGKIAQGKEAEARRRRLMEEVIDAVIGEGEVTEQMAELLENALSRRPAGASGA